VRVILQREVDRLGHPGDVVEVADGFARNFLIPRGLAVPATRGAVRHAQQLREAHERRLRRAVEAARAAAQQLERAPVRIPARAGEDGRLFGSITSHHLAEHLTRASGVAVDHRQVRLAEPIRSLGAHEVRVHLHPEVDARVTVEVVPER
jgi:large subunit ribosomal protein L9